MFSRYSIYVLFLLLCLLPTTLLAASSSLVLTDSQSNVPLNGHVEVLEDPQGGLTLAEVMAKASLFQPLVTQSWAWDKGFTRSAFWFRVTLQNHSQETDWYFMQWGALSRSAVLYLAPAEASAAWVKLEPLQYARIHQFHLALPKGSEHTLYFRLQDKQAPLSISPQLLTAPELVSWTMNEYPTMSFMMGGLLILALYNFFYFLYLRDRGFLALSVLILAFALEMGSHLGLWQAFSWMRDHLTGMGSSFGFVTVASAASLLRQWLNTPVNLPQVDRWWRAVFWLSIGLAAVSPLLVYTVAVLGLWLNCLFPLGVISLLLFYRRGLRLPSSMVWASIIFVMSMIPAILRTLGLIGEVDGLAQWPTIGLLLALMLLSMTQAQQMRQRHEQLERTAAANQAKEEFLTTMSHELRTPMTAVIGAGHLLQLTDLSRSQQEYVERLNVSSQHMLSLINDILDLARLDSSLLRIDKVSFALEPILQQVELLLQEQAHSKSLRLTLENHCHFLGKQLVGDPVRFQQVLLNLLSNAIKFTSEGGVTLSITPQSVSANNASLLFEVEDTGIGLSVAQQQKLFQPFSQADSSTTREYGGSGLGLAISHKLVQCMGGELQVESELGQGSRFFFILTLPLQAVSSSLEPIDSPMSTDNSLAGLPVLLVDDDEMNRFFGSKVLESLGLTVTTADSGETALQCLQRQGFDLVFMDVSMPGMDGYATTRRIRANPRLRHVPVIALTANVIAGTRERCLTAGMNDYLSKPFEQKELTCLLQHYLLGKPARSSKVE